MSNPIQPLAKRDFDYAAAQHLLNRAGFGGTPAQVRALVELGVEDAVDYLVDFKGEAAAATVDAHANDFRANVMRPETPEERETLRRARADGD